MSCAKIESTPALMLGKPGIGETRITVELILEKLMAGESVEQILSSHPRLDPRGNRGGSGESMQRVRDRALPDLIERMTSHG